jgi:Ca2+-binding RTX toxin-like protein
MAYQYVAAPGEANNVNVDRSTVLGTTVVGYAATIVRNLRIGDSGALITSTPLLQLMIGGKVGVATLCTPGLLPFVFCVSQADSVAVYVNLGDRDDRLRVGEWPAPYLLWEYLELDGGTGNDQITAGAGRDTINGGDGNDQIVLPADGNTPDSVVCGPGNDTVTRAGGPGPNDVISPDCEVVL